MPISPAQVEEIIHRNIAARYNIDEICGRIDKLLSSRDRLYDTYTFNIELLPTVIADKIVKLYLEEGWPLVTCELCSELQGRFSLFKFHRI
jgi:hypothetical protein